jgi:hypothetical protein
MGTFHPYPEGTAMDKNVDPNPDTLARRRMETASKGLVTVLVTILMIGCSGAPPVTPPQGPSGVITVTPASTSAAPFTIPVDSSQTFSVSEVGYNGSFSFGGSQTNKAGRCPPTNSSTVAFSAPAGVSVTLRKGSGGAFGFCIVYGSSFAVLVRDSLGNQVTIYTN